MSKYYYHGTTLYNMLEILKCGEIKCQRTLGYNYGLGNNGLDYISICNKLDDSMYTDYLRSSFFKYIKDNYCFIISDSVNAIKASYNSEANKIYRHSDKIDEYQVKDSIDIKDIIGIGIPFGIIGNITEDNNTTKEETINSIISLARVYGLDIIDTTEYNFVEKYEIKKCNNDGNNNKYIV